MNADKLLCSDGVNEGASVYGGYYTTTFFLSVHVFFFRHSQTHKDL
jgi:hypothetical protein